MGRLEPCAGVLKIKNILRIALFIHRRTRRYPSVQEETTMILRQVFWLPLSPTAFPFALQTVARRARECFCEKGVTAVGPFPIYTGFTF